MCITVKKQADQLRPTLRALSCVRISRKILILHRPLYLSGHSRSPVPRQEKPSPTFFHQFSSSALTAVHNQEGRSCCHPSRWSQLIPVSWNTAHNREFAPCTRQLGAPATLYLSVNQSEAKQLTHPDSTAVSPRTYYKLFL